MEAPLEDSRARFVAEQANERRRREEERQTLALALKLQAEGRRILALRKLRAKLREELGGKLTSFLDTEKTGKELVTNAEMLRLGLLFVRFAEIPQDTDLLVRLCRHQLISLDSPDKDKNLAALFLGKTTIPKANRLVGSVFKLVPKAMSALSSERVSEVKAQVSLIHWMTSMSSASSWSLTRQNAAVQAVLSALCDKMAAGIDNDNDHLKLSTSLYKALNGSRLNMAQEAVNALFSLLFRTLRRADFSDAAVDDFIVRVLTAPALTHHLSDAVGSPLKLRTTFQSVNLMIKEGIFARVVKRLAADGEKRVEERLAGDELVGRGGEPAAALNLLANIVHLSYLDQESLVDLIFDWTAVLTSLFVRCAKFSVTATSKSSRCHWHPILGGYKEKLDPGTEGALRHVIKQLQYLWSKKIVTCLFSQVLRGPTGKIVLSASGGDEKLKSSSSSSDLGRAAPPPLSMTAVLCQLYLTALNTLTNVHNEILSGLNREDFLLPQLWTYLKTPASQGSSAQSSPFAELQVYWQLLSVDPTGKLPHFAPLILFSNAAASVIAILDEEELYESESPFSVEELAAIAKFCNVFCFRAVWNGYIDERRVDQPLFQCVHHLCSVLYARDSRRSFTNDPKFWLAPDVKSTVIVNELEKKTERAKLLIRRMSHLVSLKERMILFRKYVALDKQNMEDASPTMITVVRTRIVEDGFRQLAALSTRALKATIRVKFVNQQGLDEAGIDQDGVFKEFLELTLKQVFDPGLNLFKVCGGNLLYPSETSSLQEDHLQLFQFVGRMLAKAVYEGIVVDVQLAPVLLATVLGGRRLCAFDELAQLDPEMYKSLSFIKRCKEDVADMCLTFSMDHDLFGKLYTVDLIPGGRTVQVDSENKIDYIHRMAHYRVFTQTKSQCRAFVSGFQEVLSASWLFLFAPHELQYLISGQTSDIDLADLRKHVQYYGGFHSGHRLIKWLWQILENDFSAEERRLFLKFVTSCSRGPLLGFAYLEPPFSIRCVEVSDDQDQGDTLASVVRGFLAIKKSQPTTRLPTASTCFNLLKLPNYSKKSVLLQKLRYAIHSETGFELS